MTQAEAKGMATASAARRFLDRQRRIRWPRADPLNGAQVAFVLNISRTAVGKLLQRGEISYQRIPAGGRPAYQVTKADLQRYLDRKLVAARALLDESD